MTEAIRPGGSDDPATPDMPVVEPQIVRGHTNELFRAEDPTMVEYAIRPRTVVEFARNAANSMRAMAVMEHATFTTDLSPDSERRFFTDEHDSRGATHRPGEPRTVRMPIPGTVSHYTEGIDPTNGEHGMIIKIQPVPEIPDIADEALTEDQQMALYVKYRQELQSPTEFSWQSADPDRVLVMRGEETRDLVELPVDELVKAAHFLRTAAMWEVLDKRDQPVSHAVLERLNPVDTL